jgi:hypothetical protein
MQYLTLASLFAAALAAPAPQTAPTVTENIDITDFYLRKHNGTIDSVNFKLEGDEWGTLSCSIGEVTSFPSKTIACGGEENHKYSFILIAPKDPSTGDADLAIYHQTGQASGLWAEVPSPPTYCHAGGNGVNDFICAQIPTVYTIAIHN